MISKEIKQTLVLTWPLFTGLALIMAGNGLQGTLLGLRASVEGFPVFVTGLVMSLYYVGFVVGCAVIPKMIMSVGHVRVFAGLASLASTTILLHGVFVDPWVWGVVRVFSGISFAGLFIVSESWLNSIATNKLRGQIFGFYLLVINGGLFAGQFLIHLDTLESINLFVLISVLVSLSMLPVTLANKPSPGYQEPDTLPLRKLIKSSKLSLVSVFCTGFCSSSLIGIGAVYAVNEGFSVQWASYFLASYILGTALLPVIVGWVSDQVDRRKAIIVVAALACIFASFLDLFPQVILFTIFFFGGAVTSIYSIGIAYMNDNIKPEQAVSASATLILVSGIGASLGPVVTGSMMDFAGNDSFFVAMIVVMGFLMCFGVYRSYVGDEIDVDDQSDFISVPARSSHAIIELVEDDQL